jgi:hypothetical protein
VGKLTDELIGVEVIEVAVMFAQSNANRKWDPISAQARMAARARWALLIGFLLLGHYLILKDLFH